MMTQNFGKILASGSSGARRRAEVPEIQFSRPDLDLRDEQHEHGKMEQKMMDFARI
jgi:hypothetical protein